MAAISALLLMGALLCSYFCARNGVLAFAGTTSVRNALTLARKCNIAHEAEEIAHKIKPLGRAIERARARRRNEEFERGMPEVLRLLCISLESGSSLVTALKYAAENCDEPLAGELKRTVWDLEAGQGFDEALEKLRERTGGSEFAFLAVAMEIQHKSGGRLTDILESLSEMLQQSAELKDELRTKTEQGRLSSRIVALMPFVLLAILSLFSSDYLATLFGSPLGIFLFALALLLELMGIVLVRRALAIDFTVDLDEGV